MSLTSRRPSEPDPARLVSVVVAARNAAATIDETLESLRSQTYTAWEAVVVDDGSTDDTAARVIAAGEDHRIRLVARGGGGVGASRTIGADGARGAMLLFLDADDWLLPTALERLAAPLLAEASVGAAYCGWRRVGSDGETISEWRPASHRDLFPAFAKFCPFAVHCCLLRRTVFDELGGFDPGLRTCEDWDLWQRLTRSDVRLEPIHETLSVYRTRRGSISLTDDGYIADGLEVVRRGHTADSRVRSPLAEYAEGAPAPLAVAASRQLVLWGTGLAIGGGRDIGDAFDLVAQHLDPTFPPGLAAETLYWAIPVGAALAPRRWPELLPVCGERVTAALAELEERTHAPRLAVRARRILERRIAYAADADCRIGGTERISVELTLPICDVVSTCERVVLSATAERVPLGVLELPVLDGRVHAAVLADALAEAFGWPLLGLVLDRSSRPAGESRWHAFLREFWDRPDWPLARFYEPVAQSASAAQASEDVIELTDPESLQLEEPTTFLLTLGGRYLGEIPLTADGELSTDKLIRIVTSAVGYDLCTAVVRDGIIGHSFGDPTPLRQRLSAVRHTDGKTAPGEGLAVMRREPALFGTAASRLAALPSDAAVELRRAAARLEETVCGSSKRPARILYRPDIVPARSNVRHVAPGVTDGGDYDALPILAYHRISDDRGGLPDRFCVTPKAFESQLRHLRDEGFRSVGLRHWLRARSDRRPLTKRSVILTFDDGYLDFATHAWPLLRGYGFGAILFVVADAVGKSNAWDAAFGSPLRLLGWKRLRRLQAEGVVIGAHSATHPPLTGLSHEEVVAEALRARFVLHRRLGVSPEAFAYPYGDTDPAVASLVGASGYLFGLTCRPRPATFDDRLLDLPRIEVSGDHDLDSFHDSLQMEG